MAMMKSKRMLHDANRKGVYINDELAPLCAKMAQILQDISVSYRLPG